MKINSLTLWTSNLSEQHRFYCLALGLRDLNTAAEPGRVTVQIGGTILTFQQAEAGWRGRYHFALDVPPDRYDEARLWLAHRAHALADAAGQKYFYHQGWNARSVYFLDPAGNVLELIARYGRQKPPVGPADSMADLPPSEHRFGPHDLLAISEIGMATDHVEGAAAALIANVPGLEVYEPGDTDSFRALGDEQGLLILVRRGRIWFPETGVAADQLPVEVSFEMPHGQTYHLTAPPYPFQVRPT